MRLHDRYEIHGWVEFSNGERLVSSLGRRVKIMSIWEIEAGAWGHRY
jgi:hypothetical protein